MSVKRSSQTLTNPFRSRFFGHTEGIQRRGSRKYKDDRSGEMLTRMAQFSHERVSKRLKNGQCADPPSKASTLQRTCCLCFGSVAQNWHNNSAKKDRKQVKRLNPALFQKCDVQGNIEGTAPCVVFCKKDAGAPPTPPFPVGVIISNTAPWPVPHTKLISP